MYLKKLFHLTVKSNTVVVLAVTCQLSLAIPSWVGTMSTGQRAVILCNWGVKADMVLFAGNTV